MKHTHYLYIYVLALLAALALPACSEDDATATLAPDVTGKEETVQKVNVKVNLSTRSLSSSLTRATEPGKLVLDPSGAELDLNGTKNEHINDWFMIIVHAGDHADAGKIACIAKRSDSNILNAGSSASEAVTKEQFHLSLVPGKYHVYTFGNIQYSTFMSALGQHKGHTGTDPYTLNGGDEMPDIKDFAWEEFHNRVIKETDLIPLSSVDSDLEVDVQTSMEIELERVIGKIQFYFANHTSSKWIRIKKFELMPIRTKTYLIEHDKEGGMVATPDHVHNDAKETILRVNHSSSETDPLKKDITGTPWTGWVVPEATKTGNIFAKCPDLGFYVNESVPEVSNAYPLGHFKLRLEIERIIWENDQDKVVGTETRSSMLHNLTAIERNQWYMQPIMFTDWVLQPEIHYYPPIGGYPVVQIEESSKFEECYSTFKDVTKDSPFQIRLRLHDGSNPVKWYDINDKTVVKGQVEIGGVKREQAYYIRVTDPDGVFNHSTLSLDNSGLITSPDGQLTGHFTGNKGRAIISVYANIEISTGVYYTYERDLYVITK